jgi:hypothetical protein
MLSEAGWRGIGQVVRCLTVRTVMRSRSNSYTSLSRMTPGRCGHSRDHIIFARAEARNVWNAQRRQIFGADDALRRRRAARH